MLIKYNNYLLSFHKPKNSNYFYSFSFTTFKNFNYNTIVEIGAYGIFFTITDYSVVEFSWGSSFLVSNNFQLLDLNKHHKFKNLLLSIQYDYAY